MHPCKRNSRQVIWIVPHSLIYDILLCSIDSNYQVNDTDVTDEVGNAAAFLASPLASAITGAVIYVDNGLNAMGVGVDSPIFKDLDIPKDKH